jgi:hypothetical protein
MIPKFESRLNIKRQGVKVLFEEEKGKQCLIMIKNGSTFIFTKQFKKNLFCRC